MLPYNFFERVIYEIDLKNTFPDDFSPPIVLYEPELSGSFYFTMLHPSNQSLTDKMTFYVLSSSTDTRDDYSVGFLIDNSLIGYMIFNMGWVHVRYEVDTTGVRTYIKYGSNEWWRFS